MVSFGQYTTAQTPGQRSQKRSRLGLWATGESYTLVLLPEKGKRGKWEKTVVVMMWTLGDGKTYFATENVF